MVKTVLNTILKAAAVVTAIATIAGGAFALDQRHAPMSIVFQMEFSNITGLMNLVRELGSTPEGCQSLDEAILRYCQRNADNYVCRPETIRDIKERAGCH